MKVRVLRYDEQRAHAAFDAHAALLKAEAEAPQLANMPSFTVAKQDAYEAFMRAFWEL